MDQMKIRKEHLDRVKEQFCIDYHCNMADFVENKNIVTHMDYHEGRRKYTEYDPMFRMVSFYNVVLVTCEQELFDWAREKYLHVFPGCILEMKQINEINRKLATVGQELQDMHHYFLPREDVEPLQGEELQHHLVAAGCTLRWYEPGEIGQFKGDKRYGSAYGYIDRHPDIIGLSAIDDKTGDIMAMAGASAEGEHLVQIGINVNEAYRGRGLGVLLVTLLKDRLIEQGKVPFYGMVSSHTMSMSIAIRSGFFPAWTECFSGPITEH